MVCILTQLGKTGVLTWLIISWSVIFCVYRKFAVWSPVKVEYFYKQAKTDHHQEEKTIGSNLYGTNGLVSSHFLFSNLLIDDFKAIIANPLVCLSVETDLNMFKQQFFYSFFSLVYSSSVLWHTFHGLTVLHFLSKISHLFFFFFFFFVNSTYTVLYLRMYLDLMVSRSSFSFFDSGFMFLWRFVWIV